MDRAQRWISRANTRIDRVGLHLQLSPARRRMRLLRHHGIARVLDVGAATGRYGRELRGAGYGGELVSFEPLPAAYAELAAAAGRDQRWKAVHTALGDREGTAEINVAGNSDSSSLLPMLDRHREAAPYANYVGTTEVPLTTLDRWVAASGTDLADRPTYLKIDAQGYESVVLDGAASSLPELAGVQMELSLTPLYDGSASFRDLVVRLEDLGFALGLLEPGFWDVTTGEQLQVDGFFFRA